MSTILRSVSMCSIWLGGFLSNIPGASVRADVLSLFAHVGNHIRCHTGGKP